jgi:hypothetical protein
MLARSPRFILDSYLQGVKTKMINSYRPFRRKHKYHAIPTVVDGIQFASHKEAKRFVKLKSLEKAGVISDLILQPVYVLQETFKYQGETVRAIKYVADFAYRENGKIVVEDTKGVETQVFKLKRKLFWRKYPDLELRVF